MEIDNLQQTPANQIEDEEVNVNVTLSSIVSTPIKLTKSLTVRDLKRQLCQNYGVSEVDQHLFLGEQRLMDTQTLADCGINKDSTIHMTVYQYDEKIKLNIKELILDETIRIVEAKVVDTVRIIKTVIADSNGYEFERLTLMFQGKLLKDDMTLESLQVEDNSTFDLVVSEKPEICINVKESNGDLFQLCVKTCFSVLHVKTLVGRKTGKPLSDWHLAFQSKLLKEWRTLAYYAIVDGTVLDIYHPKIPIIVKTWTGETIAVRVGQDGSVSDLRMQVIEKMRTMKMPRLARVTKFEYEGKEMEDGQKLSSYNIKKDSTVIEY